MSTDCREKDDDDDDDSGSDGDGGDVEEGEGEGGIGRKKKIRESRFQTLTFRRVVVLLVVVPMVLPAAAAAAIIVVVMVVMVMVVQDIYHGSVCDGLTAVSPEVRQMNLQTLDHRVSLETASNDFLFYYPTTNTTTLLKCSSLSTYVKRSRFLKVNAHVTKGRRLDCSGSTPGAVEVNALIIQGQRSYCSRGRYWEVIRGKTMKEETTLLLLLPIIKNDVSWA
ncbi:hypothetical protein M0804_009357 [Polistes exclamans]|nr:hypothetical protein M0804_009357 [Polistes exclamans]